MDYSEKLNQIQGATLDTISAARDEIEVIFSSRSDESETFHTLRRLFSYMSQRSQTVSFLVSSNYPWDAEIILRSFYESSVKIWTICLASAEERTKLVTEFWSIYSAMHDHKTRVRAEPARKANTRDTRPEFSIVYDVFSNPKVFPQSGSTKKDRKRLEQKWSFTELIKSISKLETDGLNLRDIDTLLHMYGQQSHLIHADDIALDLMLDRTLRPANELPALQASHVSRIMSDQASLWIMSTLTLRQMYGIAMVPEDKFISEWKAQSELCKEVYDHFFEFQKEFYSRYE